MAATTSSSNRFISKSKNIIVESNPSNSRLSELGINSWPKWGCPPGKCTLKTCYLVKGKVKVYPKGSASDSEFVEFGAGDLVTIPKGLSCIWDRLLLISTTSSTLHDLKLASHHRYQPH